MEDDLRRIAEENVANRRKAGIAAVLMGVIVLPMFIMVLSTEFKNVYWILGTAVVFIVGFAVSMHYEKKIIGKKSAVDLELERLKALHPDEKLNLPEIDNEELKLREILRSNNHDDMV